MKRLIAIAALAASTSVFGQTALTVLHLGVNHQGEGVDEVTFLEPNPFPDECVNRYVYDGSNAGLVALLHKSRGSDVLGAETMRLTIVDASPGSRSRCAVVGAETIR